MEHNGWGGGILDLKQPKSKMTASAVSLKCQENNNMWLTQTTGEILYKMKNKTRNIYNNNKLQTFLIWRKKQQTSGVILYKKRKEKNKNIY